MAAAQAVAHSSFDHYDHREMAVASVYAEAIYRLAEEKSSAETLLQELESVVDYLASDAGAAAFFSSPLVDAKTRARLLEKAFRGQASELLTDSLGIVQRKGRLDLLPVIVAAYRACHDQRRSVVDARVTSAVALNDAQRAALAVAIEAGLGKKPRLLERVDPAILGGLVIEVEGCKLDDSVAAQLRRMEGDFLERASGEIVRARGREGGDN